MAINFRKWGDRTLEPREVDDNFQKINDEFDKTLKIEDVTGTASVGDTLRIVSLNPIVFEYVKLRLETIEETLVVDADGKTAFSLINTYDPLAYDFYLYIDGIRFTSGFDIVSGNTLNWTNTNITLITDNVVELKAAPK